MRRRWLCLLTVLVASSLIRAQEAETPVAVRNDVARDLGPADEVLMLRHQYLEKGSHEAFYRLSAFGVWPWFERLGARITGQWQVVYPEGRGSDTRDESYRLARYASFEHWQHTRGPLSRALAGNGPSRDRNLQALRMRREYMQGSEGGYFLRGLTAATRPRFLPGLGETYERVAQTAPGQDDEVVAIRLDTARPGLAIIELRYQRIEEGSFEAILEQTVAAVWPFEEKLGARPIGQWRVFHPDAASRTEPSSEYDEMITLTRYASYAHYQATRLGAAVRLGGNGPDWVAWREAMAAADGRTLETRVEFLRGYEHASPPTYQPALAERYRVR